MMKPLILHPEIRQLGRYGLVGISSNALTYGLFLLLYHLGLPALWATGICYVTGVIISYLVNRLWTFRSEALHGHDLPKFVTAYGLGLIVSIALMWSLIRWIPAEIAQILTIFGSAAVIYLLLRLLRFGRPAIAVAAPPPDSGR